MKKKYQKPEFKLIKIDNQISLVMASPAPPTEGAPPGGPFGQTKDVLKADPYKA